MKLVVEEPESGLLRGLLEREPDQVASVLVEVEVLRAVRRAVPELLARAHDVVAQVTVLELTESIRARAARLDPPVLRSLDAVHLATALEIGDDLHGVVTYDDRMAQAAETVGLRVLAS